MNQRIIFLSHPISGDPEGNVKRILKIIRHINLTELDVVPFCPYIADALCMHDHDAVERARAIENSNVLIRAGFISECRLYGDRISPGMLAEKELFEKMGVPVIDMTEAAEKKYKVCRYFDDHREATVGRGLTLEEAKILKFRSSINRRAYVSYEIRGEDD